MPLIDPATKAKLAPVPKVKAGAYIGVIYGVLLAALAVSNNLPNSQYQTLAVGLLGAVIPLVAAYAKKDTSAP